MSRNRSTLGHTQVSLALRLQALTQPEIHAYVSSLKKGHERYRRSLRDGRKVIDDAMGTAMLTGVLYESRDEAV